MFVNEKLFAIEMSETEYKQAMTVGTDTFKLLCETRKLYPDCKPVVVKQKHSANGSIKLTKKQIEAYLKEHASPEQKQTYLLLTSSYDAEGNYCGAQPFFKVRDWFLAEFPEFTKAREDRDAQIRAINAAVEEKIAEAKKAKEIARIEEYKKNAASKIAA